MKTFFLSGLALSALIAGPALAADMPVKAFYKAPPPVYDAWTGFYVGVNVGYSWGDWSASSTQRVFDFESLTASPKVNGWLGGFQAGHNWRMNGQWLWGIEADIQITGEKASHTWTDPGLPATTPPPPPPPPPETFDFVPRPGGPASLSHQWEFPWFATLRGRVGFLPAPQWLLYVTGGVAFGETRYTFNFSQPGAAANFPPTATTYALSDSQTRVGFTVGLGTEARIDANWSVKLEYLYVDLGKVSIDTVDIDGAPFHVDYWARDHILRIGLNYRFESPVVARY
jgi:outer membrane immunogenic protein